MHTRRSLLLVFIYLLQLSSSAIHEEEPIKCYFLKLIATSQSNEHVFEPQRKSFAIIADFLTTNNSFNPSVTCGSKSSIVFHNKTFSKGYNDVTHSSTITIWYKISGNGTRGAEDVLEAYKCKENAFHRTIEKYTEIQHILKFQKQNKSLPYIVVDSQPCCNDAMVPCCKDGYQYSTEEDKCFQQKSSPVKTNNKNTLEQTVALAAGCHSATKCGPSIGIWIIISSGSFIVLVGVILATYYIYRKRFKQELSTEIRETPQSVEIQTEEPEVNITTAELATRCPTPQLPTSSGSLSNKSGDYLPMTGRRSTSSSTGRPKCHAEIAFSFNKHISLEKIKFPGTILGRGQFGQVELVEAEIGDKKVKCAAKMIRGRGTWGDERGLFEELQTLYSIPPHNNVLGLLGACMDDESPLYVLLEYCEKGDLSKYLQKHKKKQNSEYVNYNLPILDFRWKLKRAIEICNGMVFLEQHKIIHRDLAARNILLDVNDKAKISDFGMAKDVYLRGRYIQSTPDFLPIRWMAIESLESNVYSSKSDMWSFGILLWELYMDGQQPYPNVINATKLLDYLLKGNRMNQPEKCSDDFYTLMEKCWLKKENDRPQFAQMKRKLKCIMAEETRKESSSSNESTESDDRSSIFDHEKSFDNCGRTNSEEDLELQTILESSPSDHNTKL